MKQVSLWIKERLVLLSFVPAALLYLPSVEAAASSRLKASSFRICSSIAGANPDEAVLLGQEITNDALRILKKSGWIPKQGHSERPSHWGTDGGSDELKRYSLAFSTIISKVAGHRSTRRASDQFFSWLQSAQRVLDVFGSGTYATSTLPVNAIVGVRIDQGPRMLDDTSNSIEVLGNAFHPGTWAMVDSMAAAAADVKFGLITMNPIGGWPNPPMTRESDHNFTSELQREIIIGQAIQRLSDNGVFLFDTAVTISFFESEKAQARLEWLRNKISSSSKFKFEYVIIKSGDLPSRIQGIVWGPKALNLSFLEQVLNSSSIDVAPSIGHKVSEGSVLWEILC